MKNKEKFNLKGFISIVIAIIILIQLISGIALYIAPQCKIADWIGWRLWGLSKSNWEAVHTIFGVLFIISAGIHLFLNWNTFLNYFKKKVETGLKLKMEFFYAFSLITVFFFIVFFNLPPVNWIMDAGERQKLSWTSNIPLPPFPRAELATIKGLGIRSSQGSEKIMRILQDNRLNVDDDGQTLKQIAEINNTSPMEIYKVLLSSMDSPKFIIETRYGYGKKKIVEICKELNITVEKALKNLRRRGITVNKDKQLKFIFNEYYVSPKEIIEIMKGK